MIHRGMIGDAIQQEYLIEGDLEDVTQLGSNAFGRVVGALFDDLFEARPPPEHSVHELGRQSAIVVA